VVVVNLVVLACVMRAMTKKRSSTFWAKKSAPPLPPEKILAMLSVSYSAWSAKVPLRKYKVSLAVHHRV